MLVCMACLQAPLSCKQSRLIVVTLPAAPYCRYTMKRSRPLWRPMDSSSICTRGYTRVSRQRCLAEPNKHQARQERQCVSCMSGRLLFVRLARMAAAHPTHVRCPLNDIYRFCFCGCMGACLLSAIARSSCGTSRLLGKSAAPRHDSSRTFIALPAPGAGGGRLHDLAGVPGGAARRRGPQPAQLQPARAAAAWAGALAAGADGARHGGRAPARGRLPGGARQRGGGRGGQGGDVHLPGRGARPPPAPPARSLVFATSRRRAVPAPARSPRRRRPGGQ